MKMCTRTATSLWHYTITLLRYHIFRVWTKSSYILIVQYQHLAQKVLSLLEIFALHTTFWAQTNSHSPNVSPKVAITSTSAQSHNNNNKINQNIHKLVIICRSRCFKLAIDDVFQMFVARSFSFKDISNTYYWLFRFFAHFDQTTTSLGKSDNFLSRQ